MVGLLVEDLFDVDALDGGEAVFDEEGVGLPVLRIGAAVRGREVSEGVEVEGGIEGSCEGQGKEGQEDESHGDRGLWWCEAKPVRIVAMHLHDER